MTLPINLSSVDKQHNLQILNGFLTRVESTKKTHSIFILTTGGGTNRGRGKTNSTGVDPEIDRVDRSSRSFDDGVKLTGQ